MSFDYAALERRIAALEASQSAICLTNSIFRDFSKRYNVGKDFLVLSVPKNVELFYVEPFKAPCYDQQ